MSISVGGGLGVRISGGIVVGPSVGVSLSGNDYVNFLLRDDFTTAEATPLASPRTSEPGPGTLTLVQNDGQFSISDGKLNFPAQTTPVWGDLYARSGAVSPITGTVLVAKINYSLVSEHVIGWSTGLTPSYTAMHGFWGIGTFDVKAANGGLISTGFTASTSTDYAIAVVVQSGGMMFFVRLSGTWTFLYRTTVAPASTMYAALAGHTATGTLDTFRVRDLPAPFDTDTGLATAFTASPSADATITSEANAVIEFTWTAVTSETLELSVRRTDDDNRWIIRGDQAGSTVKLIEEVAGVETERASAAQTWTNTTAYRVVVVQDGDVIRGYVADVPKWTYSSASFNNTATGVKTNKAGTNLAAWPRQLSGAAATILDQSVA